MSILPFRRVIVSLAARVFVPEPYTQFLLRSTEAAVNGIAVALPEAIGLDIQQFNFSVRKSNTNIKRAVGFNVLAHDTPLL